MGRKAVNGYPEKSYYDNTVFGGIVATSDPLNEGSFALLTNVDITDSGKSTVPRKGYTSTTLTVGGTPVVLSNKILMYRDPNIQKDVIIDFNKLSSSVTKFAYLVDVSPYNLNNNLLDNGTLINNYDTVDALTFILRDIYFSEPLSNPLLHVFQNSTIVGDIELKPIRDRDGVVYYITKMEYNNGTDRFKYWLKVLYREKSTEVGGVTYAADTLVMSAIDIRKQTTNFLKRNIASELSIIPDPIRSKEDVGVIPSVVTDINRPVLLKYNNKYALTNLL
jgi:hypothetical protein